MHFSAKTRNNVCVSRSYMFGLVGKDTYTRGFLTRIQSDCRKSADLLYRSKHSRLFFFDSIQSVARKLHQTSAIIFLPFPSIRQLPPGADHSSQARVQSKSKLQYILTIFRLAKAILHFFILANRYNKSSSFVATSLYVFTSPVSMVTL